MKFCENLKTDNVEKLNVKTKNFKYFFISLIKILKILKYFIIN